MKNKRKNTLYCFSPPVMIATIIIELALAVYTFLKIKKSSVKMIAVVTLILLASFQVAEFFVCQSYSWVDGELVSRLGFVAITLLPPLGIHIANVIAGRRRNWSTITAYILAIGFIAYFLAMPNVFVDSICSGNYVIFHLNPGASMAYGVYYYSLLLGILTLNLYLAVVQKSKKKRWALNWLNIGALAFLIPTGIAYWFVPATVSGIPSIMCGFAVLYAIILAVRVVPLAISQK